MKLIEALKIAQSAPGSGPATKVSIACGFTPLHLKTFLAAEMVQATSRSVEVETGLFGDLAGNIERQAKSDADVVFVIVEWADLDPRLGIRSLGSWKPQILGDILNGIRSMAQRLLLAVTELSRNKTVVLSGPTLGLPPIAYTPGWQASGFELELESVVGEFLATASHHPNTRIVNPQRLATIAPLSGRGDISAELRTGFPYTLSFVSTFAGELAKLSGARQPLKGLITDLDDTLWRGILGEVGIEGVSWDLDHHTHIHGLYQQFLQSLSSAGVLVGVATKNDPALVERVMKTREMAIGSDDVFPIVATWGAKSESVTKILKAWNIAADGVVFVDDSPLELAEVKGAHPGIRCMQFPTTNDAAVYDLVVQLRDLFGRSSISEEDTIRLQSIRAGSEATNAEQQGSTPEEFLRAAEGEIAISYAKEPLDPRALELINKTNQFNINGKRCTEAEWAKYLRDPATFLMVVSYKDKFGPLGKIAVVAGNQRERHLRIDYWVMSCRAFARQIEFQTLDLLFEGFAVDRVLLDFVATERNGPVRDFLQGLAIDPQAPEITRAQYTCVKRPAIHRLRESDKSQEPMAHV